MVAMSGGELVIMALRRAGVDRIFSLHGAHIDPIYQACLDAELPILDVRHETNAGHAAEGYAKMTGRLGVAVVTAGGGTTNVVTSMANARLDRNPVLYICGSAEFAHVEANWLQMGYDPVALATPLTKWAHKALTIEQIPRLIDQAIRIALAPPMGPVMLDLSWTLLFGSTEDDAVETSSPDVIRSSGIDQADAAQVAVLLRSASRPVVAIGSEARKCDRLALERLAVATGALIVADAESYGLLSDLPASHAGGTVQALYGLGEMAPDVVLMLGLRFGIFTASGSGMYIPHESHVVQIDPDARELGRIRPIALGIVADIVPTIRSLADAAEASETPLVDSTPFRDHARRHIDRRLARLLRSCPASAERLHPLRASEIIASHVDRDVLVVTDGALCNSWFNEIVPHIRPADLLAAGQLGSIGYGFGTALGGQAGLPAGKRTILVTGDGAVGYSLAEFDTIVRHNLPIIVIVMNNQSWGATLQFQQMTAGPNRVSGTLLKNGRYEDVAAAFGAASYFADSAEGLEAALKTALAENRPACINVIIDVEPRSPEVLILMGQDPFADIADNA